MAYWEAPRGPALSSFLAEFKVKVDRPPILELATIPSYDAAKVLLWALEQVTKGDKTPVDVELLKRALYSVKDFSGLSGVISMDPDGAVRTIKESMYTFEGGKLTE